MRVCVCVDVKPRLKPVVAQVLNFDTYSQYPLDPFWCFQAWWALL